MWILALQILACCCSVFSWSASSVVTEEAHSPAPGPPQVYPYSIRESFDNPFPTFWPHVCVGEQKERKLADDLDMRKVMGRWFVGIADRQYHRYLWRLKGPRNLICITYEFNRLILERNASSFDVTITYSPKGGRDRKEFGHMRSSAPRNAAIKLFISTYEYQRGGKFWIYKYGPEGKDSFGRPQYEYIIIGGCAGVGLVLVRDPQSFNEKFKNEVLNWMEANGHRINPDNPFIQPAYFGCYLVSVSETFGERDEGNQDSSMAIRPSIDLKPGNNHSCDPSLTNATFVEGFDTRKLMGRWFEGLSSLPHDNRSCIVHEFRRLEFLGSEHYGIRFEIYRTYRKEGQALILDDPTSTESTDSEAPKFNSQLGWIYKVGPEGNDPFGRVQYEYVIVSNCEKSFVLVLIRTPATFENKHKKAVLKWLKENDFKVGEDNGIFPDYTGCHYADSITEMTGQS